MTFQAISRFLVVWEQQLRREFDGMHPVDILTLGIVELHQGRKD